MLSPQPDSRVSDPQTVAEASRVASVGLLSESVATDAQDNSANLVPGTESHVDNIHAQTDKDPEHPASDKSASHSSQLVDERDRIMMMLGSM